MYTSVSVSAGEEGLQLCQNGLNGKDDDICQVHNILTACNFLLCLPLLRMCLYNVLQMKVFRYNNTEFTETIFQCSFN